MVLIENMRLQLVVGDCGVLIYRDGVLVLAFIFKSLWERRNVSVNIQGDDIRLYPPWKLNTLAFSSHSSRW